MKQFLTIFLIAATVIGADVQLICNANPPEQQVTHYGFWERSDGTNWTLIGTTAEPTNGVKFQRPFGTYTWSATAFNAAGMSDYATPIEFELRDDGVTLKRPSAPVQLAAIIDPWTLFPSASGTTLTNGLIAFYKLDESSGDAVDSWGGLTMTNVGTVSFATSGGKIIGAATNATTSSSKVFWRPKWLSGNPAAVSMAAWVHSDGSGGTSSTNTAIVAGQYGFTASAQRSFAMLVTGSGSGVNTNSLMVNISADGGATNFKRYYTTNLPVGWNHVAFTFTNNVLKLYTNGVEAAVTKPFDGTVTTLHDSTYPASLLSYDYNGTTDTAPNLINNTWALDAVGIWNRVLTDAEITELYNGGTGRQLP